MDSSVATSMGSIPNISNTSVVAITILPKGVNFGPWPNDFSIGKQTVDNQHIQYMIKIKCINNQLVAENDETSRWVCYIQPARDRHEQNIEAYRCAHAQIFLRTLRDIRGGEPLLLWYSDELAREVGIPALTPDHIQGYQRYVCLKCHKHYQYPNTLKAHMRFRCTLSRAEILEDMNSPLTSLSIFSPVNDKSSHVGYLPASMLSPVAYSTSKSSGEHIRRETTPSRIDSCREVHLSPTSTTNTPVFDLSKKHCLTDQIPGTTSLPGAQPIQIFNHIHPPAISFPFDQHALRMCYPFYSHCSNPSRYCFHAMNDSTVGRSVRNNLFIPISCETPEESRGRGMQSPLAERLTKSQPEGRFAFKFPLLPEDAGEPLDLLPRSLYVSKTHKGHMCIYCGKLYSRKYGLKIHLRTHTGYKPLKCKVCFRPFGDPSNLNKHIRLHAEGHTPYRCEYCGKILVRRRDLERHIKSRHPNEAVNLDQQTKDEQNSDVKVKSEIEYSLGSEEDNDIIVA